MFFLLDLGAIYAIYEQLAFLSLQFSLEYVFDMIGWSKFVRLVIMTLDLCSTIWCPSTRPVGGEFKLWQ